MIQGCLSGGRAAVSRGDLTDTEWHILNPLLPDRGERGPAIADKRRTMNGILWVLRTGAPWRDLPERYGKWNSAFVRFTRWSKLGVWDCGIRDAGEPWASRRRGTCHRFHNCAGAPTCRRRKRGNHSDGIRNDLAERGIEPVIPPRSNRKTPIEYDREAYKRRNLIERCVNRLKQFRRIATRYEKTARAYLSMLCVAAAKLWIKTVNTA